RSQVDIRSYAVHVVDGMLRVILFRLNELQIDGNPTLQENRKTMTTLLESWVHDLQAFVAAGSEAEQRQDTLVVHALSCIHNPQSFCDAVPGLYRMDDAMLLRLLQTSFSPG
ncbi:hypothetical protein IWQ57_004467, partial [Coemansia nantahalensis]